MAQTVKLIDIFLKMLDKSIKVTIAERVCLTKPLNKFSTIEFFFFMSIFALLLYSLAVLKEQKGSFQSWQLCGDGHPSWVAQRATEMKM